MSEAQQTDELTIAGLTVRIDRTLCVGFGDCVEAAPDTFHLDDEEIAVFVESSLVDAEHLIRACKTCPVDALTVLDGEGNQLVP